MTGSRERSAAAPRRFRKDFQHFEQFALFPPRPRSLVLGPDKGVDDTGGLFDDNNDGSHEVDRVSCGSNGCHGRRFVECDGRRRSRSSES